MKGKKVKVGGWGGNIQNMFSQRNTELNSAGESGTMSAEATHKPTSNHYTNFNTKYKNANVTQKLGSGGGVHRKLQDKATS